MKRERIDRKDEESWLLNRTQDVTSTEVAALFGLSPYLSEFELFHRKRHGEVVRIQENERMTWGKRLESAIAEGVAADNKWSISHANFYMRLPEIRIGSSFDYEVYTGTHRADNGIWTGPFGLMEIKNVDGLQFSQKWVDDGTVLEAPEHIELQIQHQMEVADREYCILVALVGGNRVRWVERKRDREIGKTIRDRVAEFWDSVARNDAPSPDYSMDSDFIIKQLRASANEGEVLEADSSLDQLIAQYQFVSREADSMNELRMKTRAELLERIGTASKVISSLGNISCGMTKPSQGTLVTEDMVGTYVGGRAGYRNFRFTPKKGD